MASIWKDLLFLHGHFAHLEDVLDADSRDAVRHDAAEHIAQAAAVRLAQRSNNAECGACA